MLRSRIVVTAFISLAALCLQVGGANAQGGEVCARVIMNLAKQTIQLMKPNYKVAKLTAGTIITCKVLDNVRISNRDGKVNFNYGKRAKTCPCPR
jgi:hypothetical protein